MKPAAPDLIGGIGLARVQVYRQRSAPDGTHSGCAHLHGVTDEAYWAIRGSGWVELHDLQRGFRTAPLEPGGYVQFPAGTLHRLVSAESLEVLVLFDNGGLAERGDARAYFGRDIDQAPAEFERLMRLPAERGIEGALERRDASVRGYVELLSLWNDDREAYRRELERFIGEHWRTVSARREDFSSIVRGSAKRWLELARERFDAPHATAPDNPAAAQPPARDPDFGLSGLRFPFNKLYAL